MPAWSRVLRALFVVYVTATALHIGWIVAHEPFAFDAWNVAVDTGAKKITAGRFFDYWWFEYTHSNPRIGQAATYLAYKLDYFAVIATPLAYLALTLAVTVLGIRRWPWRKGRDLALWAIAIGFGWFALPQLGKTMFCRAYSANYVYGAAAQLWFLVPARLTRDGRARTGACIAYALAGVVAGLCNEHTGPTLCAFMVGYAWWMQRRTQNRPTLLWAGAAGVVVGFSAIFFAPGQGERYEGLAQRVTLVGRLLQRGIPGNLEILRDLMLAAAPVLLAIVVVLVATLARENTSTAEARRPPLRLIAVAMIAAVAMAATIFVSPKLGSRFYLVSCSLLLAGFLALVDVTLTRHSELVVPVTIAVLASIYAGVRTVPLYARVSREGAARIAALEKAPRRSTFFAQAFDQVDESWWYIGDDFRDARKREMVAKYFDLAGVVFHAYDPLAPLGVSGARFVPHVQYDPPSCVEDHGGFAVENTKGFDLTSLGQQLEIAVAQLRARDGNATLRQLDIAVELDDPTLVLPRRNILVGRWRPSGLEMHVGQIVRKGRAKTRTIALPKDLVGHDDEIFIYQVGGEARRLGTARGEPLEYIPWKTGVYWVLACGANDCFVIAATKQGG